MFSHYLQLAQLLFLFSSLQHTCQWFTSQSPPSRSRPSLRSHLCLYCCSYSQLHSGTSVQPGLNNPGHSSVKNHLRYQRFIKIDLLLQYEAHTAAVKTSSHVTGYTTVHSPFKPVKYTTVPSLLSQLFIRVPHK